MRPSSLGRGRLAVCVVQQLVQRARLPRWRAARAFAARSAHQRAQLLHVELQACSATSSVSAASSAISRSRQARPGACSATAARELAGGVVESRAGSARRRRCASACRCTACGAAGPRGSSRLCANVERLAQRPGRSSAVELVGRQVDQLRAQASAARHVASCAATCSAAARRRVVGRRTMPARRPRSPRGAASGNRRLRRLTRSRSIHRSL